MDIHELNESLKLEASKNGICDKVKNSWASDLDEQGLIDLWYENYDFALTNHFPKNSTIMDSFGKEILRKNNVIINDSWSLLNPYKAMVLGDSQSNIRYNTNKVGTVWIRDNSTATIYVSGHASVIVCIMDYAEVNIEKMSPESSVLVMRYSPTAKILKSGIGVRVKDNFKYLVGDE